MSDRDRQSLFGDPAAAAREVAGVERYLRYQREVRRGGGNTADGPRPREFDANGFPVPQRNPSFVERVARLLKPL